MGGLKEWQATYKLPITGLRGLGRVQPQKRASIIKRALTLNVTRGELR